MISLMTRSIARGEPGCPLLGRSRGDRPRLALQHGRRGSGYVTERRAQ